MEGLETSTRSRRAGSVVVGLVTMALAAAILTRPVLTVLGLVAIALFVAVMAHPPLAAYVLIGSTPLIVGIDRASLVPVLRPNEAVLVLLGAALVARGVVGIWSGIRPEFRLSPIDAALIMLGVTSSVLPLLWMALRAKDISADDLLYSLTLWKCYGIFLVVRASVRTGDHIRRCLWLSIGSAAIVAVIAVLQALKLFGVPELLAQYYAPFGSATGLEINRGTSTLASSIATGDVMAFNLAVALMMLARSSRHRPVLLGASGLLVFGGLASGQFSAVIALLVVVVAVGVLTRTLTRKVVGLVAVGCVAAVALQPVLAQRLSGRSAGSHLPEGWIDRLANLREYFWPTLFSHFNFVLGVRPSPRIATPFFHTGYVWIESGHTWLLWSGGIPLLTAFVVFVWVGLRTSLHGARAAGPHGVASGAAFAALLATTVLMTFDPHLTLRGAADLLFSLLALTCVRPASERGHDTALQPAEDLVAAYG